MVSIIITCLVTAASLIIISRLNVGIHVTDIKRALVAALVIGLINAFIEPIAQAIALPITFLTLGLFALVVNALLFWLAAALVEGFSLSRGFWSALLGSILLTIINIVIFWLLGFLGIGPGIG